MAILVRDFMAADAAIFRSLNLQWIEAFFGAETADRAQLDDPQAAIVEQGGVIALAELDGKVVGCGALVPPHHVPDDGRRWTELVKFATDPGAQGRGVGRAVLASLVERARSQGFDAIWLETNDRLQAATHLYERAGFRGLSGDALWPTPYSRCNLQMVLEL